LSGTAEGYVSDGSGRDKQGVICRDTRTDQTITILFCLPTGFLKNTEPEPANSYGERRKSNYFFYIIS
jgi:hypothetical protein